MKRVHLFEATSIIIDNLPAERRLKLPYAYNTPERKWVSKFYEGHKSVFKLCYPCM